MPIRVAAALGAGALALAGCAMPAAVQMGLMAGTAVSVGTTGKGLSDHAVSALTDEDCSFLHLLDGDGYCVGLAERDRGVTVAIAPLDSDAVPSPDVAPQDVAPAAGSPHRADPALFVVIGSFRNPIYAEAARRRHADLPVQLAPAQVQGHDWLRVLAGPYEAQDAAAVRKGLADTGVTGTWPLRLCAGTLAPPPCGISGA